MENTSTKRRDHQEVTALLISLGLKKKSERTLFHKYLIACHYGMDKEAFREQDQKLLTNGFDAWQVVPLEYRRNWQDQPD